MATTDRSVRHLLLDLVTWGEAVERSVGRTDRESIARDEQAELALSRAVEIVGEIAGRLLTSFSERWSQEERAELRNAYRMRNRLAHGYDDVAPRRFFDIAQKDVAHLTDMARSWLAQSEPDLA